MLRRRSGGAERLGEDPPAAVPPVRPGLQDRAARAGVADEADRVRIAPEQLVEGGRVIRRLRGVGDRPERLAVERRPCLPDQTLAVGVVDVEEGGRVGRQVGLHGEPHHDALLDVVPRRSAEVLDRPALVVTGLGEAHAGTRRADLHHPVVGHPFRQREGRGRRPGADEPDDALLVDEPLVPVGGRPGVRPGVLGDHVDGPTQRSPGLVHVRDREGHRLIHPPPVRLEPPRQREDRAHRDAVRGLRPGRPVHVHRKRRATEDRAGQPEYASTAASVYHGNVLHCLRLGPTRAGYLRCSAGRGATRGRQSGALGPFSGGKRGRVDRTRHVVGGDLTLPRASVPPWSLSTTAGGRAPCSRCSSSPSRWRRVRGR